MVIASVSSKAISVARRRSTPTPRLAARRWVEAGAEWVHVVDLDGAVAGRPINGKAVVQIRAAVDVPIQLGGGLRLLTDLEKAFSAGVERVILGTAVLRDPELVISAVARWADRIAVALDTRDGRLATDGWLGQTDSGAVEVAQRLAASGVQPFRLHRHPTRRHALWSESAGTL